MASQVLKIIFWFIIWNIYMQQQFSLKKSKLAHTAALPFYIWEDLRY